jgi:hypothetical protein
MPRFHASLDAPVGPPPEVLAQIDAAWERAQELFTTDLELHFEVDRSWGRVWAELRNPDGSVAETLSATEALAIACGDPTAPLSLTA